jgi:hypothetical protein
MINRRFSYDNRIQSLLYPLNGCVNPANPCGGVGASSAAAARKSTLLSE